MKIAQRFQRWDAANSLELVPEGRLNRLLELLCKPTATPAPAVTYGPKMPHPTNNDRPLFSIMWKTGPEPRTKPVIARDTTCSVSLLTGTICGSNFAIPSTKIPAHGNGTEFPKRYGQIKGCGPVPSQR
jgi:hypothetical protein